MHDRRNDEDAERLFRAILSLRDCDECRAFLTDLCTISELNSLCQRWAVAERLERGATYTDIARETGASTATISRVNRALAYGAGGYRALLERNKRLDEQKDTTQRPTREDTEARPPE